MFINKGSSYSKERTVGIMNTQKMDLVETKEYEGNLYHT